jgi:hypothetical protein
MTQIDRALNFLVAGDRPIEAAWANWLIGGGEREAVLAALARYQNADGGFGNGLESDIGAPASNPFAARLAMQIFLSIGATPEEPIVARLAGWLESAQGEDGCWRLPADANEHPIAPWFAGWTFPSLNPALCLAGYAARLRIGSARLQERVRRLFDDLASLEEVPTAEFYNLLPYVEYVPWVEVPNRDAYLEALAAAIASGHERGVYADAGHFFEHLGPAGGPLAGRLPASLIAAELDRLSGEQADDGGWPSPYASHWRPWVTVGALATLKAYGRV